MSLRIEGGSSLASSPSTRGMPVRKDAGLLSNGTTELAVLWFALAGCGESIRDCKPMISKKTDFIGLGHVTSSKVFFAAF
jgi:hypothetical protein